MAQDKNTWIWAVGALALAFFAARQLRQKPQGAVSETSQTQAPQVQAPRLQQLQVVRGRVQLPPPPSTSSGLAELIRTIQAAPPQPIQITAPTPEAGRAAAQEFAQYQTPWSTQLQHVGEFLQQYPTAQVQVVSPSFMEAELPPPPPGEYFSYGVIPETGTPIVYYAPQAPGIVVGSSGGGGEEMPPPPPPG